jgi:hypothetical protein
LEEGEEEEEEEEEKEKYEGRVRCGLIRPMSGIFCDNGNEPWDYIKDIATVSV